MSRLNLDITPWQVVWPRVVVIVGLSMIFAPLNVAAFLYIPGNCAERRWVCWRCCATRGEAWGRRWPRPSSNGGNSFIRCG